MPIELRSGLPGAGKTLGVVEHLLHLRKSEPERPVYVLGITDLRDGLAIPITEDELRGWEKFPAGAIIVVDECQKYMPARRGAADAPEWIKALSTHRHLGLDFILISQHPSLIDPYVRKLVDRHIHTVRVFGAELVERWVWPVIQADPTSNGAKKLSEGKSRHKYSREAMAAYKSAELHTVKRRIPKFIKVAVAVLLALPILGFLGYYAMHHASDKASVSKADGSSMGPSASTALGGKDASDVLRHEDFAKWMKPRVDGLPWSAPMFDHLEVRAEPRLFCVAVEDARCVCHTEQGTRYAVEANRCRQIVADGLYNPFEGGGGDSVADSRSRGNRSPSQDRTTGSVGPAQQGLPAGGVDDGGGNPNAHERATAAAYTPPTYGKWVSDPFGGGKSGR